jgi:hypothetical protein
MEKRTFLQAGVASARWAARPPSHAPGTSQPGRPGAGSGMIAVWMISCSCGRCATE